jgi:hypothetical protein
VVFVKREERQSVDFLLYQRTGRPNSRPSISPVTAWWHDGGKFIEIQIDDGLQGHGGGSVAEAIRQDIVPGGVFGLQGEQPGDQVVPAL